MRDIRIILVGVGALLGDLLEDAIRLESDLNLVARLSGGRNIEEHVREFDADVVILSLAADALKTTCTTLLQRFPRLAVISLTDTDRLLLRCELTPQILECGEASMDGLVGEIRRAALQRYGNEFSARRVS